VSDDSVHIEFASIVHAAGNLNINTSFFRYVIGVEYVNVNVTVRNTSLVYAVTSDAGVIAVEPVTAVCGGPVEMRECSNRKVRVDEPESWTVVGA
jgi:hypothetical protein